ncbi:hypothetical protein [Paracoccus sp. SSK6]|uniref:hypothetical protein n=1 Tax=Paracoccus sp. SSK6 TaxID=3143131 RepID=UPI0032195289
MLDQEQIEAPQFSESREQTLPLETPELAAPRLAVVTTPLTFGAAMMRLARTSRNKRR